MTHERLTDLGDKLIEMREEVELFPQLKKLWDALDLAQEEAKKASWTVYRGGTLR